jgi:ACT domain-containing protein
MQPEQDHDAAETESTRDATQDEQNRETAETDGGQTGERVHTIKLELSDEPGQLLAALRPVADNGGNLLSVVHERGSLTPRGRVPVEVDLKCPPARFETILADIRDAGVTVVSADAEAYADEVVVILVGHLVDTGLSGTIRELRDHADATVADMSLTAPDAGSRNEPSAARLHLRAREGCTERALTAVRTVAAEKDLDVIEPLGGV